MVTAEQLESDLDAIRPLVSADGADLSLEGVADGTVTLRLTVEDVGCLDCVMPKELLASLILTNLQERHPDVAEIAIIDPREEPAGVE